MSDRKEPVIVPPKQGELLACPFCGSEAGLEHDAEGTVANWYVYCRDARDDYDCPIGYTNTSGFPRRVEAAAAWNKRAAPRAMIEAPILAVAAEKGLATGHGETPEDMIRELVQGAFDLGYRAAGGSIQDVSHLVPHPPPPRLASNINRYPSCGRMFKDGETCGMGGCPMGGDF